MNYKIAKTMLVLCIVYLVGFYVLKFAFPDLLLQTITNPTILKLGEFLNSWKGFEYGFMTLSTFVTFYLFSCASSGRFRHGYKRVIVIFVCSIINTIFVAFFHKLYTHTSISLMFICAFICKGKLPYATISFVLHGYLSQFLFSIRGFETVVVYVNPISGFVFSLEALVWLTLLAIIFYFKEKKDYERLGSPLYEQTRNGSEEELGKSRKERSESEESV